MLGEFGPSKVQVPFSLQGLRQIKGDLGKFSDDPDRYIEAFQNLTQTLCYVIFESNLDNTEKQVNLQVVERFGDELCITYSVREGVKLYPTGKEAVSLDDQKWDPNDKMQEGKRRHFQDPTAFLERLRKNLVKHTSLSPDLAEGQLILKDKFITQAAPDIRRKLQKQGLKPDSTLENLLKLATLVFYNRDKEAQESERRHRNEVEALTATMQTHKSQNPQGAPVTTTDV
ncbi:hypothetical protein AAY473_039838, partial [Plecturocebus cupreus]